MREEEGRKPGNLSSNLWGAAMLDRRQRKQGSNREMKKVSIKQSCLHFFPNVQGRRQGQIPLLNAKQRARMCRSVKCISAS